MSILLRDVGWYYGNTPYLNPHMGDFVYLCTDMGSTMGTEAVPVGRFAPSPSGRMHIGNVFTALLSWLSVRSRHGRWILRIEDLDPQRSKAEYVRLIEDDLQWLGLYWDEGGSEYVKDGRSYCQSQRGDLYEAAFERLRSMGLTYPCRCTRADIHAAQAPHAADGRVIYAGTCRPGRPPFGITAAADCAIRLYVPDKEVVFDDIVCGRQSVNLARDCGDFIIRRADGVFAYQLAVTVDDAVMGVSEVVRGNDLLMSTPLQIYLYRLLGYRIPQFAHVPIVCNQHGQRLSKRDLSLSMASLRTTCTAAQIIGDIAFSAGLTPTNAPITAADLLEHFSWSRIGNAPIVAPYC